MLNFLVEMQEHYTDVFSVKKQVVRQLREAGAQPFSKLLINTQVPQDVLLKVLNLLEKEKQVRHEESPKLKETIYAPVSGFRWAMFSF